MGEHRRIWERALSGTVLLLLAACRDYGSQGVSGGAGAHKDGAGRPQERARPLSGLKRVEIVEHEPRALSLGKLQEDALSYGRGRA